MKTVVGLYDSVAKAAQVRSALMSQGFSNSDVNVIDQTNDNTSSVSNYSGSGTTADNDDTSVGSRIKHFFGSLTGADEDTHRSYTDGVNAGGALVTVDVDDDRADEVADYLQSQGARDIRGGNGNYGNTGYANAGYGRDATANSDYAGTDTAGRGSMTGEQVIPVVEEELQIGKRQVERGGVRVYSRVVSQPVSESVNLHEERVVVDRRPVDRPATDADFTPDPRTIEVNAVGEEAVVGKRSRVVEEVTVGKEATDRTEQINDTVRHTEVDVENTNAGFNTSRNTAETTAGTTAGSYRGTGDSDLDR